MDDDARAQLKHEVCERVDELAGDLVDASHRLHAHPELCFEERHAHDLLTGILERHGLAVERHAWGLETAFDARAGTEGPVVGICCEYDALPGVGHACGHNIIGAAGVGAGLAAAAVAEAAGGRVAILGTPAEEGGGGKVLMARAGAFAGVDVALMVHPADHDLTAMHAIGVRRLAVTYQGVAAHAAAFPEAGRNALDAAVLGYVNVMALRQHIRDDERLHGILTETGEQPNIVPERAGALWYVRSPRLDLLDALTERVVACLEAGATAAGCGIDCEPLDPTYAEMVDNEPLVVAYRANARALGRVVQDPGPDRQVVGSTDMGNISQLVPSIHPMIKVAPAGVAIHSHEFARWAAAPEGDAAVLDGAKAMAMTAIDVWTDAALLADARRAFTQVRAGGALAP